MGALAVALRAFRAKVPLLVKTEDGDTLVRYNGRDTPHPQDPDFIEAVVILEEVAIGYYNEGVRAGVEGSATGPAEPAAAD